MPTFSLRILRLRLSTGAAASLLTALATSSCVLEPKGLDEERKSLDREGRPYSTERAERVLVDVAPDAGWRECLQRAFAANGEIEARYFEWRAAVERVYIAAGYPNTNLAPSIGYLLSGSGMTAWDRTTLTVGFDPMQNLSLPGKVRKAGEIALAEAHAAGQRFRASKFGLQREVLDAWFEMALIDERTRIQAEFEHLARSNESSLAEQARVTGNQAALLRATMARQQAELGMVDLQARASVARSRLNALLGRAPSAELAEIPALPNARPLESSDARLFASAAENNPELHALASVVAAKEHALELARMQYLPDFNPFLSITGNAERMIGVGVSLPTQIPRIRAEIAEAGAMLRGAKAELDQARLDRTSAVVGALALLRFAERQAAFLDRDVGPVARQLSETAAQSYSTGNSDFAELLESQEALLDLRLAIAEARVERERRLAELEELAGMDFASPTTIEPQFSSSTEESSHE